MVDPVGGTWTGYPRLAPPFDATNGMEPDDARCLGACSDVLRDEHEIVD